MISLLSRTQDKIIASGYLENQLAKGKTLCKYLLDMVRQGQGDFICLSPTPLGPDKVIQFEEGHVHNDTVLNTLVIGDVSGSMGQKADSLKQLASFIQTRLTSPQHFCVLENSLANPSDPWLSRSKSRILVHGIEVYHFLPYSDRIIEKIADSIREAESDTRFRGMIGKTEEITKLKISEGRVSLGELEVMGTSAQCIFVSAYDGEGYLVWEEHTAEKF